MRPVIAIPSYNRPKSKGIHKAIESGVPVIIFVRKEQAPEYRKEFKGKARIISISGVREIGMTRKQIVEWLYYHGYDWAFMFDDDISKVESLRWSTDKNCWNSDRILTGSKESPRVEKRALKSWYLEAKRQNLSLSAPNHRAYDRFHHGNTVLINGAACIQCVLINTHDILEVGNYKSMYQVGNEDYYMMYSLMSKGFKIGKIGFIEYDCAPVGSIEDGSDDSYVQKYTRYVDTFLRNVCSDSNYIKTKVTSQGVPSITFNWKAFGSNRVDRMTQEGSQL